MINSIRAFLTWTRFAAKPFDFTRLSGYSQGSQWSSPISLSSPQRSDLFRSVKDAVLPLSRPIKLADGSETQEIHVPKDTPLFIGIRASNTDPSLWGPDSFE